MSTRQVTTDKRLAETTEHLDRLSNLVLTAHASQQSAHSPLSNPMSSAISSLTLPMLAHSLNPISDFQVSNTSFAPISTRSSMQPIQAVPPQIVPPQHTTRSLQPAEIASHVFANPSYSPQEQMMNQPMQLPAYERVSIHKLMMQQTKQWQSRLKFDLPEFHGTYGTDEVLDWLQVVEHVLQSYGMAPHAQVNVTVSRLRDLVNAWWRSLCTQGDQLGEPQITAWSEFRQKQFLPYKYK